jgi:hypothetical protein
MLFRSLYTRTPVRLPIMKGRRVIIACVSSVVCALTAFAQDAGPPNMLSVADTGSLDTKQFGLLAVQDNGRCKPIDTFAKETLTQITGRSSYTDKAGKKWTPNDFLLSVLLGTRDWKNEPMVLVSFGKLKEQLGLEKTQRRFSFAQLRGLSKLQWIVNEAHALKRAEQPLDRAQQEALRISDRLAFFGRVMDGSALLIVPAPGNKTDTWLAPDATTIAPYYNEMQFQAAQTRLQALARASDQGHAFNFSLAAHQARSDLRALSPSIYPTESQLQLEYFYNHFEGFYRAAWCYGIALLLLAIAYQRGKTRL